MHDTTRNLVLGGLAAALAVWWTSPACAIQTDAAGGEPGPLRPLTRPLPEEQGRADQASTPVAETPARGSWMRTKRDKPSRFDLAEKLNQLVISTGLVLAVCVAAIVLIKRMGWHHWFSERSGKPAVESGQPQILETVTLTGDQRLHVVQVAGARLAVGVDGTGIRSIVQIASTFNTEIEHAAERIEALIDQAPAAGPSTNSRKALDRRNLIFEVLTASQKLQGR